MPQGPKSNPLMKPFVVLALPGMYLFYKYNQYKRKRKESATRRLAERELQHLHNKIIRFQSKVVIFSWIIHQKFIHLDTCLVIIFVSISWEWKYSTDSRMNVNYYIA